MRFPFSRRLRQLSHRSLADQDEHSQKAGNEDDDSPSLLPSDDSSGTSTFERHDHGDQRPRMKPVDAKVARKFDELHNHDLMFSPRMHRGSNDHHGRDEDLVPHPLQKRSDSAQSAVEPVWMRRLRSVRSSKSRISTASSSPLDEPDSEKLKSDAANKPRATRRVVRRLERAQSERILRPQKLDVAPQVAPTNSHIPAEFQDKPMGATSADSAKKVLRPVLKKAVSAHIAYPSNEMWIVEPELTKIFAEGQTPWPSTVIVPKNVSFDESSLSHPSGSPYYVRKRPVSSINRKGAEGVSSYLRVKNGISDFISRISEEDTHSITSHTASTYTPNDEISCITDEYSTWSEDLKLKHGRHHHRYQYQPKRFQGARSPATTENTGQSYTEDEEEGSRRHDNKHYYSDNREPTSLFDELSFLAEVLVKDVMCRSCAEDTPPLRRTNSY